MAGGGMREPLDGRTVQELQSLAAEAVAADAIAPRAPRRLSRAARLHLIDQLSRRGGAGLALFAGVAIFLMVVARDMPMRAAIWAAIMFCALYICRRHRKEFRRGDRIAAQPFRWRANYTAAIAVVSAAFGAGAFLLVPPDAVSRFGSMETLALLFATACIAAGLHIAHRPTALASGLPAFAAIALAAFVRIGPGPFAAFILAAGVVVLASLYFLSGTMAKQAGARFPRTSFIRREVEPPAAREVFVQPRAGDRAAAN